MPSRLTPPRRFPPRSVPLSFNIDSEQSVLVVPDVHQDLGFLERVVRRAETERAALVFLGDYVDSINPRWRGAPALQATAELLPRLARSHSPGCHFLAGNHDVQALQAARHRAALLEAGDVEQVRKLDAALPLVTAYAELRRLWPREFLLKWRLAAEVHGYLVTHAGVARRFWPWAAAPDRAGQTEAFLREASDAWEDWVLHDVVGPLFEVGPGRGGVEAPVGGLLWLDWDTEFVDDLPLPQVVGHTRDQQARRKDRSWCLDACQTCVALIEPDIGLRVLRV